MTGQQGRFTSIKVKSPGRNTDLCSVLSFKCLSNMTGKEEHVITADCEHSICWVDIQETSKAHYLHCAYFGFLHPVLFVHLLPHWIRLGKLIPKHMKTGERKQCFSKEGTCIVGIRECMMVIDLL